MKLDYNYLISIIRDVAKNFVPCRISSPRHLEELLSSQRTGQYLFGVDDTQDGSLVERAGSFYDERDVVVFFIARYNPRSDSLEDRQEMLLLCRSAFLRLVRRVVGDIELDLLSPTLSGSINYHELPGQFLSGFVGLYASIPYSEALDLSNPECLGYA